MVRLAYSEQRRCLALSHCYVVRCAQRLSSGYSFLRAALLICRPGGRKLAQPQPGVMRWTTLAGRSHTTRPTIYEQ